MSPQRIQRKRTKGWRMPEGAVFVGRPGKWGNPWKVYRNDPDSTVRAVDLHRHAVVNQEVFLWPWEYGALPEHDEIRAELAGKDLACWCPLDDGQGNRTPCHAEVLLEIANGEVP